MKANIFYRLKLPAHALVLIGGLAFITGFAYFLHFKPTYQPDSASYILPAESLLRGHGLVGWDGYPDTMRTPGYPLLILPFLWTGLDLKYLVIFQHLLRIILILGAAVFVVSLAGNSRQAIIAGVVLCIDLPLLSAANSVLTEVFFTFVLCAGVWLLRRDAHPTERPWPLSLLYGFVCGLTVLIRPVSLFLFVPAAAYLLLVRRNHRWRAVLSFVFAFAILPSFWAARNYHRTGYFTVSSISEFNLLFYRAAGALAIEEPGDFNVNLQEQIKRLQVESCAELEAGIYGNQCAGVPFTVAAQHFGHMGRAILKKHPVAYMKLMVRGAAIMMLGGDASSFSAITGINPHLGVRLLLIYTVPAFCLAIGGLVRFWTENRHFFHLTFLVILYFVVVSAGAEAYSRLRVPIIPIYAALIASGLDWIYMFFFRVRNTANSPKDPLKDSSSDTMNEAC